MRFIGKIKEDIKNVGTAIAGFFANRRLSEEESLKYDITPRNWHQRLPITPPNQIPPASGLGYTQSPYVGQFTIMWGVNPLADLGKYRLMYRTVPIIKKAVDKTVATAVSKGFKLELDEDAPNREDILDYLTQWISKQEDFKSTMQMMASDALLYGNSFSEIVYDEIDTEEKYSDELKQYKIPDPHENYKFNESSSPYLEEVTVMNDGKYTEVRAKGNPVWIKPLDPLWVRVRRDSFGNCFGFLQYLSTPPIAFTTGKMVHIRYNAKSWWTECFIPETLVRTEYGVTQIKDVQINDRVLMDDGNIGYVENVKNFDFDGDLIKIKTYGYNVHTLATPNHPFFIKRLNKKYKYPHVYDQKFIRFDTIWSRADQLTPNDYIEISIPTYIEDHQISDGMLRLLGFYVAEGCTDIRENNNGYKSYRTTIYFYTPKDYKNLEDIELTLNKENIKYNKYYSDKTKITRIESHDKNLYNILVECGKYSYNKVFPNWVMDLPPERQMIVVNAFIDGDGCKHKNRTFACTTSEVLAHQIQTIYLRNKIYCSIVKKPPAKKSYVNGRAVVGKHNMYFVENFNHRGRGMLFDNNKLYVKIRNISTQKYIGKVYNLDISDQETFCVNAGYVAHNSAYGTSALQSLIRTQEAIWTIENDLILISHACAKPPLIFSCGLEDEPWTEGQLTQFVSETGGRGPGGDIYHRGDVEAKPLPFPASSLAPLIAHLDYHVEQRIVALGVPPDLLGIHASSNRSVATVSMDDWINTIQLLQEQIADAFEEQLFKVIVERKFGEGAPIPRIVWNQIYEKDQLGEANTIIALRGANIITLNEARVWLEEIGKKLHPIEGGNIFGTPQVVPPQPNNEPEEDGIDAQIAPRSEIDEGVDAFESSFKSEYTDLERESYVYTPEEEDDLVNDLMEKEATASDEFINPGLDTDVPNQLMYPLLNHGDPKKKTHIASRVEQNIRLEKLLDFDGIEFWKVSSDKVAELYDPKWKYNDESEKWIAGHHYVFSYISPNEIWVSDLLNDDETKKAMVHEYIEMKLMKKGMSYAEAHQIASAAEGNLSEIKQYIPPEKVEEKLDKHLEKIWIDPKGRKVIFDQKKGEISLVVDGLVKRSKLVRSYDDVEKFIKKLKSKFVEQ